MRRRFIADTFSPATGHPTHAALTGEQAAHLARVLRAQPGQVFDVVADGFLHRAEITSVSDPEVLFTLHEELEADAALPIHLLLAVFKFDHFEWAIEKATELGVAGIAPVIARRTEKHLAQAAEKRVERWRRIAHEAAQQSRRSDVPVIHDTRTLSASVASASGATRIVLAEQERTATLIETVQRALAVVAESVLDFQIAVGPEGGWAPEEEELFAANDWKAVTLGPRILRAETAAIAALSVFASLLD